MTRSGGPRDELAAGLGVAVDDEYLRDVIGPES
jgi:hypothetical protein